MIQLPYATAPPPHPPPEFCPLRAGREQGWVDAPSPVLKAAFTGLQGCPGSPISLFSKHTCSPRLLPLIRRWPAARPLQGCSCHRIPGAGAAVSHFRLPGLSAANFPVMSEPQWLGLSLESRKLPSVPCATSQQCQEVTAPVNGGGERTNTPPPSHLRSLHDIERALSTEL